MWNQVRVTKPFIAIFLLYIVCLSATQADLEKFYSYGPNQTDWTLDRDDDAEQHIELDVSLPFFGIGYNDLYLSSNGLITLGKGYSGPIPAPFPINDMPAIASYWTDSDLSKGGAVYFRQVYDKMTLDTISKDISRAKGISYTATWAFIATFDNVAAYGCTEFENVCNGKKLRCSDGTTHQITLTTDEVVSFAIVKFKIVSYTAGADNCNGHALIGYNSGYGISFNTSRSNTSGIAKQAAIGSNVDDHAGIWIFKIDQKELKKQADPCNKEGILLIVPRLLSFLGKDSINIYGPCFDKTEINTEITVMIGRSKIKCKIISKTHLGCISPLFKTTGRKKVSLMYDEILYESFVQVFGITDNSTPDLHIETIKLHPDIVLPIKWNSATGNGTVEIRGIQEDYSYDLKRGRIVNYRFHDLNYVQQDTGKADLLPITQVHGENWKHFIRVILLNIYRNNTLIHTINLFIKETKSLDIRNNSTLCSNWHKGELSDTKVKRSIDNLSRKNPCPPEVPSDFPRQFLNFFQDSNCNPTPAGQKACDFFHPGAKGCYKSVNKNNNNEVVRCCYAANNSLLLNEPNGGSVFMTGDYSKSSSGVLPAKFYEFGKNTFPFLICCKFESLCGKYYSRRPSIDFTHYRPPRMAGGKGDPHFVTLDGTAYDFNPVGEFIYLVANNDVIQCRISQYVDSVTGPKPACYFSAFAVRSNLSDIIQIELNLSHQFTFILNKVEIEFNIGEQYEFVGINLNVIDNKTCVVQLQTGISLEFTIASKMLHVIVTAPQSVKGQVHGLIGNWDDDPTNDLMMPNGTWIPANSTNADIHYLFGMSWATTNESSLFKYTNGLSWEDYQDSQFVPVFSDPPPNPVCNNDKACEYDILVTNDVNVGLSNIQLTNRIHKIETFYSNISCLSIVNLPDGKVFINDIDQEHFVYTLRCNSGYSLIGPEVITCTRGVFSADFGQCRSQEYAEMTAKEDASINDDEDAFLIECDDEGNTCSFRNTVSEKKLSDNHSPEITLRSANNASELVTNSNTLFNVDTNEFSQMFSTSFPKKYVKYENTNFTTIRPQTNENLKGLPAISAASKIKLSFELAVYFRIYLSLFA